MSMGVQGRQMDAGDGRISRRTAAVRQKSKAEERQEDQRRARQCHTRMEPDIGSSDGPAHSVKCNWRLPPWPTLLQAPRAPSAALPGPARPPTRPGGSRADDLAGPRREGTSAPRPSQVSAPFSGGDRSQPRLCSPPVSCRRHFGVPVPGLQESVSILQLKAAAAATLPLPLRHSTDSALGSSSEC